jgi:hypothetical protein
MSPSDPPSPKVDLFPTDTLDRIASDGLPKPQPAAPTPLDVIRVPGWLASHDVKVTGPFTVPQPSPFICAENRKGYLGPLYAAISAPGELSRTFEQNIDAEAALSLLPAALLGPAIKPAVDWVYGLIDKIPAAVRRPFERNFGLLVDNALSLLSGVTSPLVDHTLAQLHPNGAGLPTRADLQLQPYGQFKFACAETAAATILKADGVPVALADVDTQISGFDGTSGIVDAELRRRGLTLVSGVGNATKLKAFLAQGYPVLVSVGWEQGGGHAIVVSGYDEEKQSFIIDNWDGAGGKNTVKYADFLPAWSRRLNVMTAVVPTHDRRLDDLVRAGDVRRPDEIQPGLSLSDFFVTEEKKVFVEAAYRYVTASTDLTLRLSYTSDGTQLAQQLNGSIALRQHLADGWCLGVRIAKLSLKYQDDNWYSFTGAPLAVYASLQGPGFSVDVGEERGSFQASLAVDLGRFIAGLGLNVNGSIDADGRWSLNAGISGNF